MICNAKTTLKVAAALGASFVFAYFALPGAQAFIVASAPVLLALVCPLSMLAMMFVMRDMKGGNRDETSDGAVAKPPTGARNVGVDKAQAIEGDLDVASP